MSGALDFLFEGQAPPSVTTYGSSTTDLPKWLSDYTQGLIGRANSIAGEGYQPYEGPRLAGLNSDQQRAFDITRGATGMYTPWIQGAQMNAAGALARAQPFIDQAGQTYTGGNVNAYMNPYVENVINRGSQLATRTLNEQFLPSVEGVFGRAGGTPRSSAYRRAVDTGVRNLTEGLNAQNQAALADAYTAGGSMFGADASRLGALGQTVGNLSLNQGQLGGALAEQAQNLSMRDAAANAAVGDTLQQDEQRSLDLAYEDFARQRDYPRQNVDWLSSVIRGTPHATTTNSASTGPPEVMGPSPIGQLGSLATGIAGLMEIWKGGKARGGRVMAPRGALAYA